MSGEIKNLECEIKKSQIVYCATKAGGDFFDFIEIPLPTCQNDELLIKINYIALNHYDYKFIKSRIFEQYKNIKFPVVLGLCATGTVIQSKNNKDIGRNVIILLPTDKPGTYAQYVCCDSKYVADVPPNIDIINLLLIYLNL